MPFPQQILWKKPCQPFHCIHHAVESNALLPHDEFKPSVCHQSSVCSYVPVSMTECCWAKESIPQILSNAFILSTFSWRKNSSKFFVGLTQLLPPTKPTNKRHHIRAALLLMGRSSMSWPETGDGLMHINKPVKLALNSSGETGGQNSLSPGSELFSLLFHVLNES